MHRNGSRDISGRFTHTEDRRNSMFGRSNDPDEDRFDRDRERAREDDRDRGWFERAANNVRGWFHSDDRDRDDRDRERDDDRYLEHEERAGRADHQVFGGRGLQAYDNPREIQRDEERRFGGRSGRSSQRDDARNSQRDAGYSQRDAGYSQPERDWFHHRDNADTSGNNRSWVSGDEPPRGMRDRDAFSGDDYSRQRGDWRGYDADNHDERPSMGGIRDRSRHGDLRVRAMMREEERQRRARGESVRGFGNENQNERSPDRSSGRPSRSVRADEQRRDEQFRRYEQQGNRYMRHDEPRSALYDRDDDRSRSGDAFGRLKDEHGRYAGGPVARDERHRYADTDDDSRNNWRSWSGRASQHDGDRPYAQDRERLARDDRSRLAPARYDERYGHPSTRGNRLDYDQQFASNTERGDDNRASRTSGRDEDQDRSFVPRDEYGRRRR